MAKVVIIIRKNTWKRQTNMLKRYIKFKKKNTNNCEKK